MFRCDICNEEARGKPAYTGKNKLFHSSERVCYKCRNMVSRSYYEKINDYSAFEPDWVLVRHAKYETVGGGE